MLLLNWPEVFIPAPRERLDAAGRLTDDQVRQAIRGLPEARLAWSRRLRHP